MMATTSIIRLLMLTVKRCSSVLYSTGMPSGFINCFSWDYFENNFSVPIMFYSTYLRQGLGMALSTYHS